MANLYFMTVQEQAWGETTWHAPEDRGDDWALQWQRNEHRWLPHTTFDGLVTAAYRTFAMITVDSSRDRWAYGTPGGLALVPVAPTVTFGGQTIYFDTINTAQVGLNLDDGPSPRQPRIAVTNIESLEWEQAVWSREVWIADYETSTGMAKLTTGYDGYLVYPHYRHHPEILQPLEHTTVRVKVELAEPVPDGMVGTLHLAWYDPGNRGQTDNGSHEHQDDGVMDNSSMNHDDLSCSRFREPSGPCFQRRLCPPSAPLGSRDLRPTGLGASCSGSAR